MSSEFSIPDAENLSRPTALTTPFSVTRLTASRGNATKKFRADLAGNPERDPTHPLGISAGRLEHLLVPGLEGLRTLLCTGITTRQALVHGVVKGSQPGDIHKLVLAGKPRASGEASRSLNDVAYPEPVKLIMLDIDPEDANPNKVRSAGDLVTTLAGIWPAFAEAGWLVTVSTSSALKRKADEKTKCPESDPWIRPPDGMHVYMLVTGDVTRFRELARKRLWLAGCGYFKLASPNKQTGVSGILQRTIIDLTVFSPERLDYVSGAMIDKTAAFYQDRPAPEVHDGDILHLDSFPAMTEAEEAVYSALVLEAKAPFLHEQQRIVRAVVVAAQPSLDDEGIAAEVSRRLEHASAGVLPPEHMLFFASGFSCPVAAVTAKLDRQRLADPAEPEYRDKSQATFFWNHGGTSWRISSWSHGTQKSYRPLVIAPVSNDSPAAPPLASVPLRERFRVDEQGVWYQPPADSEGNKPPEQWVCAPLYVVAATRDEQSDNHGHLLEFTDRHGHPQQWAMPLALLEEQREYRKVFRRLGLLMNGGAQLALQTYLEVSNAKKLALCVPCIGWHKDVYVLPMQTIGGNEDREQLVLQTLDHKSEGYRQAGSLDGWRTEVSSLCVGNSRLILGMSAGFAASLLTPLDEESGGLHLRGGSSIGKTIALHTAATVWGEPGRIERWRVTVNALEGVALAHNDNLLCLDEIKELDPREAGAAAYMLANGVGKRRGQPHGGTRPRLTWRLLFLSTGEMSLEQHMTEVGHRTYAGHEVRLVDLPADAGAGHGVFEDLHGAKDGEAFANRLHAAGARHYGYAGRAFVEALSNDLPGNMQTAKTLRDGFVRQCLPADASGQVSRVAKRFALIGAAGEMATEAGITGWPAGAALQAAKRCFQDWVQARGGAGNAEDDKALAQVRVFFERYGESRFKPWTMQDGQTCERCQGTGKTGYSYKQGECFDCRGTGKIDSDTEIIRPVHDRAGFRRATNDGRVEYYVFPEVFKQEIAKGLDTQKVARMLADKGLLYTDKKGGKLQVSQRLPGIGRKRVYHIHADILGTVIDEEVRDNS